jgi:hypothetical protein
MAKNDVYTKRTSSRLRSDKTKRAIWVASLIHRKKLEGQVWASSSSGISSFTAHNTTYFPHTLQPSQNGLFNQVRAASAHKHEGYTELISLRHLQVGLGNQVCGGKVQSRNSIPETKSPLFSQCVEPILNKYLSTYSTFRYIRATISENIRRKTACVSAPTPTLTRWIFTK